MGTRALASCSSTGNDSAQLEPVTRSSEPLELGSDASMPLVDPGPLLLTPQTNFNVTGTTANFGYHEVSIAPAANGSQGNLVANWVIGFNNCSNTTGNSGTGHGCSGTGGDLLGWAYSSDLTGSSWTFNAQTSICQFGDPCGAVCQATACMSDGNTFGEMAGDPTVAPVTDSTINDSGNTGITGKRVLYTNLASSSATGSTDVIVLVSDDGGRTWGHPHLVTTVASGGGIDNPVMASHFASPWHTYVAWTQNNSAAYMRSIQYDASFHFTTGPVLTVPPGTSGEILHPAIAVGDVINCSGGTDEGVYVAWTTSGEYCNSTTSRNPRANSWWFAVYDTATTSWSGPWEADSDPAWPQCVGNPLITGGGDSDSRPRLAVEPSNTSIWIAHTQSTPNQGTRMRLVEETLICVDGSLQPQSGGVPWQSPDTCYLPNNDCPGLDGGTGVNGPNNTYIINDVWGPEVAFVKNTSTGNRELIATWYDTGANNNPGTGDSNNRNVRIQGAYAQAANVTYPTTYFTVSAGTGIPWDHTLGTWWDYQGLQPNYSTFSFLGAWGGDARLGANKPSIYSAVIK
jgi:hypothetical protein